jgi:hypothetical protein
MPERRLDLAFGGRRPPGGARPAPEPRRDAATNRGRDVTLRFDDVDTVAAAASARFHDPDMEARRMALLAEVNHAARELSRHLADHTRHTLVEYCGSHSAWDLRLEGELYYTALARYVELVRAAADWLRPLIGPRLAGAAGDPGQLS